MLGRLPTLLAAVAEHPDRPRHALDLVTAEDRDLIATVDATGHPYRGLARLSSSFTARMSRRITVAAFPSAHRALCRHGVASTELPAAGISFEYLVRHNIEIGRPDKVNVAFDHQIRRCRMGCTPSSLRTQGIIDGVCPHL